MTAMHQRNDEIHKRIKEASQTHVLHAMIERAEDIEATVLALEDQVPAGYETFAPPRLELQRGRKTGLEVEL